MYQGKNMFVRYAEFIDVSDIDYFREAVAYAARHPIEDLDKRDAPVIFCSSLSAQKKDESYAPRSAIQDRKRAKRRFLMIDADYDPGFEEESEELRNKIIELAERYQTPVLIYPTLSYPEKPRFRAVLFVKNLLNDQRYEQAMLWLFRQLDARPTDTSDLRINANRNLPIFRDEEQIKVIYTTLDDDSLSPLDNNLWKNDPLPQRRERAEIEPTLSGEGLEYDRELLFDCVEMLAGRPGFDSYETFWFYVSAVALEVVEERLTEEEGERIMDIFASSATDDPAQEARWSSGNRQLLDAQITRMYDPANRARVSPLYSYAEIMGAVNYSEE